MFTPEQIEAMEEENMMQAVLEMEAEMQEAGRAYRSHVPHIPEDGEETDERDIEAARA